MNRLSADEIERRAAMISELPDGCGIAHVARQLGITRQGVYVLMENHPSIEQAMEGKRYARVTEIPSDWRERLGAFEDHSADRLTLIKSLGVSPTFFYYACHYVDGLRDLYRQKVDSPRCRR